MPLMEVVIQQEYANQQCISRLNYLASGTPAAVSFSFALVDALGGIDDAGVYPAGRMCRVMAEMQHEQVNFIQIGAKDVYSVDDFYETPFVIPLSGVVVGNGMGPATAYGFKTNRTRLDVRRGTKRYVGVSELHVATFGLIEQAFLLGALTDMAQELGQVLTYNDEGNDLTFTPVIVGKEKYSPSGDPDGPFAYRYYPTQIEQLDHLMSSITWTPYLETRTQVSRQYGRGR